VDKSYQVLRHALGNKSFHNHLQAIGFLTCRWRCSVQGPNANSAETEQCAMARDVHVLCTPTCAGRVCDTLLSNLHRGSVKFDIVSNEFHRLTFIWKRRWKLKHWADKHGWTQVDTIGPISPKFDSANPATALEILCSSCTGCYPSQDRNGSHVALPNDFAHACCHDHLCCSFWGYYVDLHCTPAWNLTKLCRDYIYIYIYT